MARFSNVTFKTMSRTPRGLISGQTQISAKIDYNKLVNEVEKKQMVIYHRAGGYTRTRIKRQIRRAPMHKRLRTVEVYGKEYVVPVVGAVVRADDYGKKASGHIALIAKQKFWNRYKQERRGKPPLSKLGGLRKNIYYDIVRHAALDSEVFIGPEIWGKTGSRWTPDTLEFGGSESRRFGIAQYGPHPYVMTQFDAAYREFVKQIKANPLGGRAGMQA